MPRESSSLWIAVVITVSVVAGLWYYSTQLEPTPRPVPPVESQPPIDTPSQSDGPLHPIVDSDPAEKPTLRPLPALDDSDEYFKLELSNLYGSDLSPLLAESRIVERIVATVDNLPRRHIAERARPISGLGVQFPVDETDRENLFLLNPDGYRRYDSLIQMFASADMVGLTNLYRRYYPLLQKAYEDLGYPNGYFNDRLIEVIDHLQDTPDAEQPVLLVRTHVLYEFVDDDLERLSSGQKLLLRMGPEHAATVKARLAELRSIIADQTAE